MACPAIITGDQFLTRVLMHIDCQAQIVGSYGYQALGQPGSTASVLVTGLLTLFIALFGFRLMFGPSPGMRDIVNDVLKIGIVLTLAFSWPAFRTLVYDVTLKAPGEIASAITASSRTGTSGTLVQRLQAVDDNVVELIEIGTGRNTGQFLNEGNPGANFAGTALQDDAAFGYSRLLFLSGVIAPLALLRIAAAFLLAIAPLVAGLLFFSQSRGIAAGWARGLVFTIGGSIIVTLGLSVELAIVEPWLADALQVRQFGYATPAAPLELFATMFAFLVVQFAMLWLLARVVFYRGWITLPASVDKLTNAWKQADMNPPSRLPIAEGAPAMAANIRAQRISTSIENAIRREQSISTDRLNRERSDNDGSPRNNPGSATPAQRLGSSYRKPVNRPLRSIQERDLRK